MGMSYAVHLSKCLSLWLSFSLFSTKQTPFWLANPFFFFLHRLTPLITACICLRSNLPFQSNFSYLSSDPVVYAFYSLNLWGKSSSWGGLHSCLFYLPPMPRSTYLKCNWKLKPLQKLSKWANICLNYSIYNSKNISSVEVCVQEVAPKPFLREFWHQWNVMLAGRVKCLINKESQCFQTHIPSSLIWRKPQTENALLLTVTRGLCISFLLTQSAYFGAWVGKKHGQQK